MTFSFKGSFIVTTWFSVYFSQIVLGKWGGLRGGGEKLTSPF